MKKDQTVIIPKSLLLEVKENLPPGKTNVLTLKGKKVRGEIILQEILQSPDDYTVTGYRPVVFRQTMGGDVVFLQLTPQLKTTLSEEALIAPTNLVLVIKYVEPLAVPKRTVLPNSRLP